ncbi:MAG: helix-turn-helix domain containing protein [Microbacterium sp.]|uniref:TetR/AcrR family transcriptional regulator n=1 Tax=Microbacterium sp. TaxID=51671 RepID=UPI002613E7B3|nr:TetR/AcrR family transcriptional regulator [Microbacterium sp.]MCX6502577.1 helix-turn-helix domain containing protein [Microbacterium sp.]
MRPDAARRRETIVQEARALLAAHGAGVTLESVAEASGVGIATLYRNFASRTELADAVALAILADIEAAAASVLARFDAHPEAAWHDFLIRLTTLDLGALTDAVTRHGADDDLSVAVRDAHDQALARVATLVTAARSSGLMRVDLDPLELVVAIGMITRPQPPAVRAVSPHLVPRLVAVFEAGLRG